MDGEEGDIWTRSAWGEDGGRWVEMWDAISMLTSFGCFALYPLASTQDSPDPYFRPPGISRHAQSVNLILPPSFTRVRCPEPRPPVVVRVGVCVREPRGQPSHLLGWRNKREDHIGQWLWKRPAHILPEVEALSAANGIDVLVGLDLGANFTK